MLKKKIIACPDVKDGKKKSLNFKILKKLKILHLHGVIVGKAIYDNSIDLNSLKNI
jgi:hypothetical protein